MLHYFKHHIGMIISMVVALILSFSMAIVAMIWNAQSSFSIELLIRNWGAAFLTVIIISMILPLKTWGDRLASVCGLKLGSAAFSLLSNLVPTLFFNTFITMIEVGINIPGGFSSPMFWTAVAHDYMPMFTASYLLSFVAEKAGLAVVKSVQREV